MIQPGLYGENRLLGAKVRIISSPAFDIFPEHDNQRLYFIERIEYHITNDGKIYPAISLVGLNNKHYLPRDLEIVELATCNEQP